EFIGAPAMQDLQGRITCRLDPEIEDQGMDVIRSRIEVKLKSGKTLVEVADTRYRGGPDNPLSDKELEAKTAACVAGLLDADREQALIDAAWGVAELKDATELARVIQTG
ncbi:MAG TPA: MmgE/PrpD family protein, partial [Alphaproteobacteria bacterium]|nr:MmgE/PrpD family protein [Alphaproteobacteria bacterium]